MGETMNEVIMLIMACGVVLGGIDKLLGNKKGYGKKLEEGFMLLGPMALSMVGIICIAPVLANAFSSFIIPAYEFIGVDPAMFGGNLAIDMGGYSLAKELANQELMGSYAGIVVASIFGCTIVFTIPVGMGLISKENQKAFATGIMIGFIAMPVGLCVGGLLCGLGFVQTLHQNSPIFLLSLILMLGLWKKTEFMIKAFQKFAQLINIVIVIGLMFGAVSYMTGMELLPYMTPIQDALATVSSIGIVLLGSLPITELFVRLMKIPLKVVGKWLKLSDLSIAGMLVGTVSTIPSMIMLKDMEEEGKIVNVAFQVCGTAMLAAHLGFTVSVEPEMLPAMLLAKATGALASVGVALFFTRWIQNKKQ